MVRGARLKRMGLQPGWPDLQFLHKGRYYGMEIKTSKVRVSKPQRDMRARLAEQGCEVAEARSVD